MPTDRPTFRSACMTGLQGARANLIPGLVLQAFALALVLGYYFVPGVVEALQDFATFRDRAGIPYSMISTALFGGLIPWLYIKANPATRHRYGIAQGIGLILFWAYKGLEIHWLYSGMAALFGHDNSFTTVATKVVVDQTLYGPLLAAPGMWLAYKWVENHLAVAPIITSFRQPGWFLRELLPVIIANLGVWLPTVSIIYTLPTVLQLPLENLVLCFFTLMLAHMSQAKNTTA